jgi:hypothetical protein
MATSIAGFAPRVFSAHTSGRAPLLGRKVREIGDVVTGARAHGSDCGNSRLQKSSLPQDLLNLLDDSSARARWRTKLGFATKWLLIKSGRFAAN